MKIIKSSNELSKYITKVLIEILIMFQFETFIETYGV